MANHFNPRFGNKVAQNSTVMNSSASTLGSASNNNTPAAEAVAEAAQKAGGLQKFKSFATSKTGKTVGIVGGTIVGGFALYKLGKWALPKVKETWPFGKKKDATKKEDDFEEVTEAPAEKK